LLESNNRAATLLQQQVGTRRVLRLASSAGLQDLPDVPSQALGTGLVTPLAITTAFAMFPNGGLAVRPRDITRVRDADGGSVERYGVHTERVLSPEAAFQMVSMLSDAVDRGTGAPARRLGVRFALPIWADFMQRAARIPPPSEFERPAGLREESLCASSYLKPVDGCPIYSEFSKDGDHIPDRLCTVHRGSVRQRLARTVQGWSAEVGRRVRGIFR